MIRWLLIGNILLTSYNEFYDSRKILNFSEAFAPLQKKSEEKIFVRTKYLKSVVNSEYSKTSSATKKYLFI